MEARAREINPPLIAGVARATATFAMTRVHRFVREASHLSYAAAPEDGRTPCADSGEIELHWRFRRFGPAAD
jgi:hypothetical protein